MFAKIYDIGAYQVLVQKGNHPDDGAPIITTTMEIDDAYIDCILKFFETDAGRAERDFIFETIDADAAFRFVNEVLGKIE